jgi:hypothetical protein
MAFDRRHWAKAIAPRASSSLGDPVASASVSALSRGRSRLVHKFLVCASRKGGIPHHMNRLREHTRAPSLSFSSSSFSKGGRWGMGKFTFEVVRSAESEHLNGTVPKQNVNYGSAVPL